jgi:ketosteroid isomerase-like protein
MDDIQKELVNIEKSIVKLFNEKKIKEILQFFSKDFIGFSSTKHERLTSLSQLKKTFLHYLDEGDEVTYAIENLKVKIYGEAALTTFYWIVHIKKKKKVKTIDGRGSHVFLLGENGWHIVHEHYSKAH